MKSLPVLRAAAFTLLLIAHLAPAQTGHPYPPVLPASSDVPPTPQQKLWALGTCAILTELNHGHHDLLGGSERTPEAIKAWKNCMEKWWDVHNRKELLDTLTWIEDGGHRREFDEIAIKLSKLTLIEQFGLRSRMTNNPDMSNKIAVVMQYSEKFSKGSIAAWDYGRYVSLCGWGYITGYLSEKEAWEKIMPAARLLQKTFDSWTTLGENYAAGREFWTTNHTLTDETRQCIDTLSVVPSSPWVKLDWNMSLSPVPADGADKGQPHTIK